MSAVLPAAYFLQSCSSEQLFTRFNQLETRYWLNAGLKNRFRKLWNSVLGNRQDTYGVLNFSKVFFFCLNSLKGSQTLICPEWMKVSPLHPADSCIDYEFIVLEGPVHHSSPPPPSGVCALGGALPESWWRWRTQVPRRAIGCWACWRPLWSGRLASGRCLSSRVDVSRWEMWRTWGILLAFTSFGY